MADIYNAIECLGYSVSVPVNSLIFFSLHQAQTVEISVCGIEKVVNLKSLSF